GAVALARAAKSDDQLPLAQLDGRAPGRPRAARVVLPGAAARAALAVRIGVGRPLPHVPGHVECAVRGRARGAAADRLRFRTALRENGVVARRWIVSPREPAAVGSARRLLPLGIRRQALPLPAAVRGCLLPSDGVHGMLVVTRPRPVPSGP